jgi:hypothetical protein
MTLNSHATWRAAVAGCSALALLAACDNEPDIVEGDAVEGPVAVVDPLVPVYTLTPEQQQRRDVLDMPELQRDYASYVEADRQSASASDGAAGASGDASSGNAGNADPTAHTMPSPVNMTFADLDRNDDDRLSVAEWAIYAVGLDPTVKKGQDDQTPPYATAEQLNRAADGFFAHDSNGDTYLQQAEFQQARANTEPATG